MALGTDSSKQLKLRGCQVICLTQLGTFKDLKCTAQVRANSLVCCCSGNGPTQAKYAWLRLQKRVEKCFWIFFAKGFGFFFVFWVFVVLVLFFPRFPCCFHWFCCIARFYNGFSLEFLHFTNIFPTCSLFSISFPCRSLVFLYFCGFPLGFLLLPLILLHLEK